MRPEIITASADSTHISAPTPMSEVHDNGNVDIQHIGEQAASQLGATVDSALGEERGMFSQVFSDMVEDVFGPRKTA